MISYCQLHQPSEDGSPQVENFCLGGFYCWPMSYRLQWPANCLEEGLRWRQNKWVVGWSTILYQPSSLRSVILFLLFQQVLVWSPTVNFTKPPRMQFFTQGVLPWRMLLLTYELRLQCCNDRAIAWRRDFCEDNSSELSDGARPSLRHLGLRALPLSLFSNKCWIMFAFPPFPTSVGMISISRPRMTALKLGSFA